MAHRTAALAILTLFIAATAPRAARAAAEWRGRHYASSTFLGQPGWYSRYGEGIVGWWHATGPEPGEGLLQSASPFAAMIVKTALKRAYPERLELQGFVLPAVTMDGYGSDSLRLSWIVNLSRGGPRYQIAGLLNLSRGEVRGAQLGLVNVARSVTGAQIGLVNVARSVDGVPIGLVNIVEDGIRSVELWGSDTALVNAGLRLGSRTFYTMIAAGVDPLGQETRLLAGLAGGIHLETVRGFSVDVDQLTYAVRPVGGGGFDVCGSILTKTRLLAGIRVTPRLGLYTGVTANVSIAWGGTRTAPGEMGVATGSGPAVRCRVLPGFLLGARFHLSGAAGQA
jgi:hypothetical protein